MVKAAGKETQATRVKQLLAGINKHFTDASAKLTVGSVTYTVAQLTSLLQSFVDIRAATDAAKAAASARVLAETAQAPPLRDAIAAFVAYVRASFGNSPDTLADFGLSPRKARAPLSAEQTATAVAKRQATRQARRTMGSQQKKAVKGSVQVTITSTPLAPAQPIVAPAAPVAPAASPAGGAITTASGTGGAAVPHA
jgi:hypothetical protein